MIQGIALSVCGGPGGLSQRGIVEVSRAGPDRGETDCNPQGDGGRDSCLHLENS
jgi:hypothetical protein